MAKKVVGQPQRMMQEIIEIARTTSLHAAQVNWEVLEAKLMGMTEEIATVDGLKPVLEQLLNTLGDKHGVFRKTRTYEIVAYCTACAEVKGRDKRPISAEIVAIINDLEGKFSFQKLDGDIGYLQLRSISPAVDVHTEAEAIRAAIRDLDKQGVDKWIVDLRYNGGGNMNPMLAGLAPLLGEGIIGGAVNANGEKTQKYSIRKGVFYDWERLVDALETEPLMLGDAWVAVLLSRYTVSSGELVAVAFKGRENTRFFGEPSGGLTTVTGYDIIEDELIMTIAKSTYVDRNKVKYDKNVPVDEATNLDPNLALSADEGVRSAAGWLRK